jgi:hypothetical protein
VRVNTKHHALLAALAALAAAGGCNRIFKSAVTQPNPLTQPLETLRESEVITIVTGDMELNVPADGSGSGGAAWVDQRYPLRNMAHFTVVSRDRLRFHVQIEHKWQEWADVSSWNAYVVDDQGRHYDPADIDLVSDRHITKMWDYEQRSTVVNSFGDVVAVNNDGYKRRQALGSMSLFRGRGDFVFHHRNIFSPALKSLTLHIERSGTVFEFTWRFHDDAVVAGAARAATSI